MNSSTRNPYTPGTALDQLYQKYHDAGWSPAYFLQYFAPLACCALFTFISSLSLIVVTLRCRLNGSFNIFMAFESFGAVLFSLAFIVSFLIAFSGKNVLSIELCVLIRIFIFIGAYIQNGMMLIIGIERLFCIQFPIWYKFTRDRLAKSYICFVIFLNMIYVGYICTIILVGISEYQEKDLLCNFNDWYNASIKAHIYRSSMITQVLILTIYCMIWFFLIKARIMHFQITNTYNMHIMKSLTIIMAFIMFGWLNNAVSPFYLPLLKLSQMDLLMAPVILTSISILSSGSNAPILYIFSSEYKKSYRKVFRWLLKRQPQNSISMMIPMPKIMPNPIIPHQ